MGIGHQSAVQDRAAGRRESACGCDHGRAARERDRVSVCRPHQSQRCLATQRGEHRIGQCHGVWVWAWAVLADCRGGSRCERKRSERLGIRKRGAVSGICRYGRKPDGVHLGGPLDGQHDNSCIRGWFSDERGCTGECWIDRVA